MLHDLPILKNHYDFRAPRFSVSNYLNLLPTSLTNTQDFEAGP